MTRCFPARDQTTALTLAALPLEREKARSAIIPHMTLARRVALFLDIDGTLIELARRPDEVVVPARLVTALARLHAVLDGALSLVSGRAIRQIDALFAPLELPCAGVHGAERRDCKGKIHRLAPGAARRLDLARASLSHFVAAETGLLLEDKGSSLAVHFRARPELAAIVERRLEEVASLVGEGFRIQESVLVREIVPTNARKGDAVEAFLAEAAFAGRIPVFVGDDVTDLDAFAAVERHGGRAIAVGIRLPASWRLPSPSAVLDWLEFLISSDGRWV